MSGSDSTTAPNDDRRLLLEQALHQVRAMRARLDAVERAESEPIAVIGMSCRFPGGANDLDAYWRLLREGGDAIGPMPLGRWSGEDLLGLPRGETSRLGTSWAGALDEVDTFDAAFFGLSPEEATRLDPQHRLVLEVAWEAIEHAGQTLEALQQRRTGVFVGIYTSDYLLLQLARNAGVDVFTASGAAHSLVANRLSYTFDFRGPSVAIDTACSSSLAAVHLACRSLRARESDVALAGGVNLILSPVSTVLTARVLPMAPDGRCKTFDTRADGIVRGEGCGVVVLKRLSDALADRDPISALVRGSAMNHDGRTNGLTAPSSVSQQAVLSDALKNARVNPLHISLIEAHGTGTPLGDAIELEALREIYDADGPDARPCAVGSVKTNLGHLEAAAGIAGFIKVALALQHREIPAHLHMREPNPLLGQNGSRFFVPSASRPLKTTSSSSSSSTPSDEPPLGCVSSFGFGGANVHVVLQHMQAQPAAIVEPTDAFDSPLVLAVSARSAGALAAAVSTMRSFLASSADSPADICYTAAMRRTHHRHRCAVVGRSRADLLRRLSECQTRLRETGGVTSRPALNNPPKIVFSFSNTAGRATRAVRALLERQPTILRHVHACDAALQRLTGQGLIHAPTGDAGISGSDDAAIGRVASFAVETGISDLLRSWGVHPEAVLGQGEGEVAAAFAAGAFDVDQAVRLLVEYDRRRQPGALAWLNPADESTPIYAAATGGRVSGRDLNSRRRIDPPGDTGHAGRAIGELIGTGHNIIVELGEGYVEAVGSVMRHGEDVVVHLPLQHDAGDGPRLSELAASLYELGVAVQWRALYPGAGRCVALPSYPWQRRRHWIEARSSSAASASIAPAQQAPQAATLSVDAMIAYLTRQVADALRSDGEEPADIDPDVPLRNLDLDSLTVVDLKNQAERDLHVTVPLTLLMEGPSIRAIASTVGAQIAAVAGAGSAAPVRANALAPDEARGLLQRLDALPDRDVEEILGRLLGSKGAAETV